MDGHNRRSFLAAFSQFWNNWGREEVKLKLFVCGSYGRVSRAIYLSPFTLSETEKYLNDMKKMNYDRQQVLDTYMVLGGIWHETKQIQRDRGPSAYTNLRLKQRKIVPGFFVLARKASESVPRGTVRVADAARAEKTGAR